MKKLNISMIVLATLVLLVAFISLFAVRYIFDLNLEESGQVGDWFGIAGAIISGAAFAGVIYALILQRQDMSITKQELREQREQQIFFALMNLHEKIVDAVTFSSPIEEHQEPLNGWGIEAINGEYISRGRDSFYWFCDDLYKVMTSGEAAFSYRDPGDLIVDEERLGQIITAVRRFYTDGAGKALDRYFRSTKRMLAFLDSCSQTHQQILSETFSAQVTVEETLQMSYYSTNVQDHEFKTLLTKYNLTDYDDLRLSILGGVFMQLFGFSESAK